ncbi:hypothetical protein BJV77DRAFT_1019207 [Russula vinacea]|nr:hypothetical protein BJV77DRAFT_1019207 [Russula vinacea]
MTPPPLPDGLYTIGKGDLLATLQSDKPGTDVVLLPANRARGQRWEIRRQPNGYYIIINQGTRNSLSFEGQPEHGKPVKGFPDRPPREWSLNGAIEPHAYKWVIYVAFL